MKNIKIKSDTVYFILILIFFAGCKNQDNIEPKGRVSGIIDNTDWFKKNSTKILKPFGEILLNNASNNFCKTDEIIINFGVRDSRENYREGSKMLTINIPKTTLSEGKFIISNINSDCSKQPINSSFGIYFEDPPNINYLLNIDKENYLKILKIDKINKFIEAEFQLNYKISNLNQVGYEQNLDFKNGYFKIYYNIEL